MTNNFGNYNEGGVPEGGADSKSVEDERREMQEASDGSVASENAAGSVRASLETAWNEQADGGEEHAGEAEGTETPAGTQDSGGSAAGAAPKQDAPQPVEAPSNWPAADREMFAKLGPDGQQFLARRHREMEGAFTRRMQEIAPWRQVNQQWGAYFQQLNVPAPQAINLLLETEYKLRNGSQAEKIGILEKLVQDYGIAAPGEDAEGNVVQDDPRIAALQQQIDQMHYGQAQQQQAAQQRRIAQAAGALQAFAEAKDADGRLKHPYYGEVKNDMTRLAQAEVAARRQPHLEALYDSAVWANPAVRAKMMAADNQEKVQKAKAAGIQVAGGGGAPRNQPQGLRETLEAAYDAQVAR